MKRTIFALAVGLCLAPGLALAGEQANAPTATGETGLFTLLTGDTLPQGEWSFGLYFNNWDRELKVRDLHDRNIDYDWTRASVSVGVGITDRFELALSLPYDDYRISGFGKENGLGDAHLGAKFRLTGERGGDSALALNLFIEGESADNKLKHLGLASDEVGFGGSLDWRKGNFVLDAGYRDPRGGLPQEALLGFGYAGRISDRLDWITELAGTFYNRDIKDSYDLTTGGRLWLGDDARWAFNFGLRADLAQISNSDNHCPVGGLLGFTYFPRLAQRAVAPAPAPQPVAPPLPAAPPPPAPTPAPPPPPPPPAPAPKPEQREVINFGPGSARLSNIAKAKLDEVALKMKQDPALRAEVIGYSDSKGSDKVNLRISKQRAEAVRDYLVKRHGIDASRISIDGKGAADPVASNDTEAGRKENRRAVVILKIQ